MLAIVSRLISILGLALTNEKELFHVNRQQGCQTHLQRKRKEELLLANKESPPLKLLYFFTVSL